MAILMDFSNSFCRVLTEYEEWLWRNPHLSDQANSIKFKCVFVLVLSFHNHRKETVQMILNNTTFQC